MTSLTVRRGAFGPLFDDFLSDLMLSRPAFSSVGAPEVPTITRARMDVLDKGEKFEITMDLPGVKKEDINVSIEGARVSVNAEAKLEREVKEGERLLHSERYAASYARSFELPAEVTEEAAEAKFENGVLTLALPKRAPVVSRKLMIK
ncbi:MAG TPA: Hsp20/alpha crystallin family protein [Burkholderiaceae bacterium]|jgi:HSP20 family protein|nr:Hsp20/alpha crystallin family protein [Burkholderiaceae bacterium]HPE00741.1 Hsp20/alpha crystallin family protein [Burkholderiaceae bacterium]HRZ00915.1 Hsp20/alpha crystallin family protein [Burkholderiaceae bacterium]